MLLLATLTATLLSAQEPGEEVLARELERICDAAVADPRPSTLQVLTARLSSDSGSARWFLEGCQGLVAGDWGKAGAAFERATQASPGVAIYHFWFGRATGEQTQRANIFRKPGLARRTRAEFERAIAIDSSYIPAREGLLRYYLAAPGMFGGSVSRAREQADVIRRLDPYRGGLAFATISRAEHDTVAVVAVLEELTRQFPDSVVPRLELAELRLTMKEWSLAWVMIDEAGRLAPTRPAVRFLVGRAASESGEQLDRGEAALNIWLQEASPPDDPSLAPGYYHLGCIAERRGDSIKAQRAYEAALRIDRGFTPARDALARLKKGWREA